MAVTFITFTVCSVYGHWINTNVFDGVLCLHSRGQWRPGHVVSESGLRLKPCFRLRTIPSNSNRILKDKVIALLGRLRHSPSMKCEMKMWAPPQATNNANERHQVIMSEEAIETFIHSIAA
jgi:hypothetical protein